MGCLGRCLGRYLAPPPTHLSPPTPSRHHAPTAAACPPPAPRAACAPPRGTVGGREMKGEGKEGGREPPVAARTRPARSAAAVQPRAWLNRSEGRGVEVKRGGMAGEGEGGAREGGCRVEEAAVVGQRGDVAGLRGQHLLARQGPPRVSCTLLVTAYGAVRRGLLRCSLVQPGQPMRRHVRLRQLAPMTRQSDRPSRDSFISRACVRVCQQSVPKSG